MSPILHYSCRRNRSNVIRKITLDGEVSTFAGVRYAEVDLTKNHYKDGDIKLAEFSDPTDLVFDSKGNLFVVDSNNDAIRKISPDGIVSTFAKKNENPAQLLRPRKIAIDSRDNLYVSDSYDNIIKINPEGLMKTEIDSLSLYTNKRWEGRPLDPHGIAISDEGDIFVCDTNNHRIRKFSISQ